VKHTPKEKHRGRGSSHATGDDAIVVLFRLNLLRMDIKSLVMLGSARAEALGVLEITKASVMDWKTLEIVETAATDEADP